MAASEEYTAYVLELLEPVGPLRASRLFGGVGISRAALQFAMVMDNRLYLAVDDATRGRYEAAGMAPFSYQTKQRRVQVRRYFEVPEHVFADPELLCDWARESLRAAAESEKPRRRTRWRA